jgi:hypothetical protein
MALAYKNKKAQAIKNNVTDPAMQIQYYNGLGVVKPETEQSYHKFKMQSIYGVPLPPEGISMKANPLYGKQILDIRDNILKADPNLQNYIQTLYNSYQPDSISRDMAAPLLQRRTGGNSNFDASYLTSNTQWTKAPEGNWMMGMQDGGIMKLQNAEKKRINTAAKGFNDYIINVTLSKSGGSAQGNWLNKYN